MVAGETIVFLLACLLGGGLGLFFDSFRLLRVFLPHPKFLVFFEDISFCIVSILVSFAFVVSQGNGILRGFMVFGELIGAVIYFITLGNIIKRVAKKVKYRAERIFFLFKRQKTLEFATKDSV